MIKFDEVHILSEELIPLYHELDRKAQEVIKNHSEKCDICKDNLSAAMIMQISSEEEKNQTPSTTIKPFKQLHLFKRVIGLILVVVRLIVIALISKDFFEHFSQSVPLGLQFEGFRANLLLFYTPLSMLLLAFTWFFLNKRAFVFFLIVDILVLYFLDNVIRFFV